MNRHNSSHYNLFWMEDHPLLFDLADPGLFLGSDPEASLLSVSRTYPMRVPKSFVRRMRRVERTDPLLRQVLPSAEEMCQRAGFVEDPLEERADENLSGATSGLLRKYAGRALLLMTNLCAVHCRYCFRRHGGLKTLAGHPEAWEAAWHVIERDESIREVIFSGGDPLMLSDAVLSEEIKRAASIRSVRRVRIHTRMPVVLPERVNDLLITTLTATRLMPVMVIHVNHPAELDDRCRDTLQRIALSGIMLLNQSVLLKGVNDDAEILAELSERLMMARVIPYYLHLLDPVAGAAHFHVNAKRGGLIVARLREKLPGYAVPRLVREIVGEQSKRPI